MKNISKYIKCSNVLDKKLGGRETPNSNFGLFSMQSFMKKSILLEILHW